MRVSRYDRFAGLLLALLVLMGVVVGVMLLLLISQMLTSPPRPVAVEAVEELRGRGDHAEGLARELEEPGVEEFPETPEPQLAESLTAVTSVLSDQQASLEALEGSAEAQGTGAGRGDSRAAGPGGEGDADVIPRWERWEVRFASSSEQAYAQQLDYFGIELGAVGGGSPQVDYVSRLSAAQPQVRQGRGDQEQRLYMSWNGGVLKEYDARLLDKAGVSTQGRVTLQFYPPSVEATLADLELQKAHPRTVREIEKTVFAVRQAGAGQEFYVVEQRYR